MKARFRLSLLCFFPWVFLVPMNAAQVPDNLQTRRIEVCGVPVSLDLHPNTQSPGVAPRHVRENEIGRPGDICDFVLVMYDYHGARRLEMEGSVTVRGTVVRRSVRRRDEGLSFLDVDRMLESYRRAAPEFVYRKVQRNGGSWVERRIDPPEGDENRVLGWLVSLREDILIIFQVELSTYFKTEKRAEHPWLRDARALQDRIFNSLVVDAREAHSQSP